MRWLKVSAAGRRPPLDGPGLGLLEQQLGGEQDAEPLHDRRAREAGDVHHVGAGERAALADQPQHTSRVSPDRRTCAPQPYRRERGMSSTSAVVDKRKTRIFCLRASEKWVRLAAPLREDREEGRVARALLLEAPRALRLRDEPATRLARRASPREGAAQRHQPRHRAQPLPRHLRVRRPRLRSRPARVRPPRPAAPDVSRDARLRARRHRRGDRRRGARARAGDLVHVGAPHRDEAMLDLDAAAASTYPPVRLPGDAPLERWLFVSVGAVALRRRPRRADQARRSRRGDRARRDRAAAGADGAARGRAPRHGRRPGGRAARARARARRRRGDRPARGARRRRRGDQALRGPRRRRRRSRRPAPPPACTTRWRRPGSAGRVVTVGFYQGGAPELRLGEEWHHNRLELVSSMGAWGAPHRAYPAWDRPRVMRTVVDLLASGAVRVDALPVRHFPLRGRRRRLRLARRQPERRGQGGAHLRRLQSSRRRAVNMRRAALICSTVLAAVAAGCGGGGDDDDKASGGGGLDRAARP